MNYKREHFKDCIFNPYGISDSEFDSKCSILLYKYPEFKEDVSYKQNIISYIVYVYDKNSPLKEIMDINEKKKEALLLAKFRLNKENKFDKYVEDIIVCNNKIVNKMIIRYSLLHYDPKYSKYVVFYSAYERELSKLMSGEFDDKEKAKEVIDNINRLEKEIDLLVKDILNKDDNGSLLKDFYKVMDDEVLGIFPEEIAKSNTKKQVINDPYSILFE